MDVALAIERRRAGVTGLQSRSSSTMSARETSAGGIALGMQKWPGSVRGKDGPVTKLSSMPSLAECGWR